jgi:hypothetical protein
VRRSASCGASVSYLSTCAGDGGDYRVLAQGLAASGGCSELLHVFLYGVKSNVDWVAYLGLVTPSVCYVSIQGLGTEEEALLLCCGLVQAGYKYSSSIGLRRSDSRALPSSVLACMRAVVSAGGVRASVY